MNDLIFFPERYNLEGKEPGIGELKLYVDKIILNDIESYLFSDTVNELGGALLGYFDYEDEGSIRIVIKDIIIAIYTESSASRLTFTHKTWDYINSKLDDKRRNGGFEQSDSRNALKIVGWFHSHPGYGVFMSGYDEFIQEKFFNSEYMVSLVWDPIRNEKDFFYIKNGRIEKLSGYYVRYSTVNLKETMSTEAKESCDSSHSVVQGKNTGRIYKHKILLKDILLIILTAINIGLIIFVVLKSKDIDEIRKPIDIDTNFNEIYK